MKLMDKKRWLFTILTIFLSLTLIEGGALLLEKLEAYLDIQRYKAAFEVTKVSQVDTYVRTTAHPYMASHLRFNRSKNPDTYRIFCLGGSAAMGWPHSLEFSYPTFLQRKLLQIAPYRNFEVINAAASTYSSHQVRQIFDEIRHYQPDLVILFTGNNEFLYHYARQSAKPDFPLASLRILSRGWELLIQQQIPGKSPSFLLDRALGDDIQYKIKESEKEKMLAAYQKNLLYMQQKSVEAGVSLLLMTLPANIRDWRPHASIIRLKENSEILQKWQELYKEGRITVQAKKYQQAVTYFRKALELDSSHAALHFELGQALLKNQQLSSAGYHLRLALSQDAYPLRATPAMNDFIRSLAADTSIWLLDVEKMLASRADDQLIGDDLLVDHVHPTVMSNELIAEGVLKIMDHQGLIRLPGRESPRLAPDRATFLTPTYMRDLFLIYRVMHQFDKVRDLYWESSELANQDRSYAILREELESYLQVAAPFQALQEAKALGLEDSLFTLDQVLKIKEAYIRTNRKLLENILTPDFGQLSSEAQENK